MFDLVLTYDDTNVLKPSPIPFRRVLHHFQIQPEQALMIGDWPERDITGAAQVGIITVFARYGDTFGTKESGAHYDVDDIFGVLDIVDRINGSNPAGESKS
jgi:putative hydrolase of the HAD superfamily